MILNLTSSYFVQEKCLHYANKMINGNDTFVLCSSYSAVWSIPHMRLRRRICASSRRRICVSEDAYASSIKKLKLKFLHDF